MSILVSFMYLSHSSAIELCTKWNIPLSHLLSIYNHCLLLEINFILFFFLASADNLGRGEVKHLLNNRSLNA